MSGWWKEKKKTLWKEKGKKEIGVERERFRGKKTTNVKGEKDRWKKKEEMRRTGRRKGNMETWEYGPQEACWLTTRLCALVSQFTRQSLQCLQSK